MPVSPAYRPDPRFMILGPDFSDPVTPADFPRTILRWRHDKPVAEADTLQALESLLPPP